MPQIPYRADATGQGIYGEAALASPDLRQERPLRRPSPRLLRHGGRWRGSSRSGLTFYRRCVCGGHWDHALRPSSGCALGHRSAAEGEQHLVHLPRWRRWRRGRRRWFGRQGVHCPIRQEFSSYALFRRSLLSLWIFIPQTCCWITEWRYVGLQDKEWMPDSTRVVRPARRTLSTAAGVLFLCRPSEFFKIYKDPCYV